MEGFEILSQSIQQSESGMTLMISIVFYVMTLVCLVGIVVSIIHRSISDIVGLSVATLICFGAAFASGYIYQNRYEYTEYKVIFTEKVDMNEFNKKYDVVSQEGKIFTLREKSE